jgi:hypothetical protein
MWDTIKEIASKRRMSASAVVVDIVSQYIKGSKKQEGTEDETITFESLKMARAHRFAKLVVSNRGIDDAEAYIRESMTNYDDDETTLEGINQIEFHQLAIEYLPLFQGDVNEE